MLSYMAFIGPPTHKFNYHFKNLRLPYSNNYSILDFPSAIKAKKQYRKRLTFH